MSLASQVTLLATRIGQEIKAVRLEKMTVLAQTTAPADTTAFWIDTDAVGNFGMDVLTTTERDALSSPNLFRGRTIFNTTTGGLEVYYGATTGWKPPWNTAWGEVVKTTSTASTTGIAATSTDIVTATFTAVANRRYKITFSAICAQVTTAGAVFGKITDNTPTVLQTWVYTAPATSYFTVNMFHEVNPSAGSVTYRGRLETTGGTIALQGGGFQLHYLLIEDIGPNGNAPSS